MLWCKTIYSLHQIMLLGGCHTTSEDGVISSPRCFKGRVSSTYTLSLARHPCNYQRTPPLWRTHICNCEGAWMARVIFTFFNWRHARSYSREVSGRQAGWAWVFAVSSSSSATCSSHSRLLRNPPIDAKELALKICKRAVVAQNSPGYEYYGRIQGFAVWGGSRMYISSRK